MLSVQSVSHGYDRLILSEINFSVKQGEIVSIVGRSGAGKSTLLKIIAGKIMPEKGDVFLEMEQVTKQRLIAGHSEIGLVNQDFKLDEFHSVEENIRLQILHLKDKIRDKFIEELLSLVGLTALRSQQARLLSGGEQQRLAIARMLAKEPKLILLDEPFSHLDQLLRNKLINYLLDLVQIRSVSIILVSHDGAEVLGLSDKVYFLKNGKLKYKGTPFKLYYHSKTLEEGRMFGPLNSVKIGEKRILFRPDEFTEEVVGNGIHMDVVFEKSIFNGILFENHFLTSNKEKVVLYQFNSMKNTRTIYVQFKNKKA
ncbi:MAG: ATP-binding cassette domain-containing protein [Bacteroidota bacterium]